MTPPPVDRPRIEAAVLELLAAIGEDVDRPGLESTPRRVADAYVEFFSGLTIDAADLVRQATVSAEAHQLGEVVIVRDISFRSVCEHHLLPFVGVAHVAYVPGETIVGLGALPRVVDAVASRPQLQERLGEEIAEALQAGARPDGVLVVLDASHGCVTTRGPRQTGSTTVTLASRGVLSQASARAEAVALIGAPRA
ncbi:MULTISPECIES: GTP cyclohydrolase I FolE [unclassified Frigoribacterium]|jgi:GTP cyclohydrolase I|uniref:GTP cyclohydrolase I FolE n=1 Tax=unclassified Frigoribacterium TaxID=2627005 RepID=UPI0005BB60BE|nr:MULTISPECIES: GTP cyclohydrolase I FolE [unclassified Frigoribacterium]KIU03140.1 GTP cyclohydrolase [Frigoribacterium sp. MEB024]MBD8539474.1 GTP cyclohydrolase I FolE [Frigoribacterium sp. CFBP 8751]